MPACVFFWLTINYLIEGFLNINFLLLFFNYWMFQKPTLVINLFLRLEIEFRKSLRLLSKYSKTGIFNMFNHQKQFFHSTPHWYSIQGQPFIKQQFCLRPRASWFSLSHNRFSLYLFLSPFFANMRRK